MTGKTHLAGGVAIGATLGLASNLSMEQFLIACIAGGIGGLIPDIDSRTSIITSHTGVAGSIISRIFQHRGMLHTPVVFLMLNCFAWTLVRGTVFENLARIVLCGLFSGEISHLLLDGLNSIGIMWLWPYRRRFSILHVSSKGIVDTILHCLLICVSVSLILYKLFLGF